MRTTLLALALLATFVVQAATPREAPLAASPVETLRGVPPDRHASLQAVPGDSGQVHGRAGALRLLVSQQTSTPAAALPSTGAPVSVPAITPEPSGEVGTALLGGWASWYDVGPGYYAAAGPLIREALGDWRGELIEVVAGDRSVIVQLVDACACGPRHGKPTLLDLSWEAFSALADPSIGIIAVSVELGVTLPPTDTPDQHPEDPPEHPDDDRMREEVRGDTLYEGGTE